MKSTFLKRCLLVLFVALFVAGCKKDDENGGFVEMEFLKFADFGCENGLPHLKPQYAGHYYIVSSQQELDEHLAGDCITQIDFSKYMVIIGSKSFPTGASLYDESVKESEDEVVYTVTFKTDETAVAMGVPYHVVIKKTEGRVNKNVKIIEVVKDQR